MPVNANADSDYLATQSVRDDDARANAFLGRVNAMKPEDRAAELAQHGISEDEFNDALTGRQQELAQQAQRQHQESAAAGAHEQNLETAVKVLDPLAKAMVATGGMGLGAGYLAEAGAPVIPAILGGALWSKISDLGAEGARALGQKVWGQGHPIADALASLVGGSVAAAGPGAALSVATGEAESIPKALGEETIDEAKEGAPEEGAENVAPVLAGDESGGAGRPSLPTASSTSPAEGGATSEAASTATSPSGETPPAVSGTPTAGAPSMESLVAETQAKASQRIYTPEYNRRYLDAVDEARRGVVSRFEQAQSAAFQPATRQEVESLTPGSTATAETATALVNFERDEANTIRDLAGRALDEGDQDARAEALQRIDSLVSVYDPKIQGVTAETGRSLGAFNQPTPAQYVKAVRASAIAKIGTPGFMTEDEVLNAFRGAPREADIAKLSQGLAQGAENTYSKNFFVNTYISTILSPNSVAKKLVSDAMNIAYQVPARALGEGAGYIQRAAGMTPEKTITPGETAAMVRAIVRNFGDAMNVGWQSAKENRRLFSSDIGFGESIPQEGISSSGTRFENTPVGAGIDYYGHLISVPGRAITGVDQAAKVFHYRMEMAALAEHNGWITATNEGREGADFSQRAAEVANDFMAKSPQWAVDQAFTRSKVETFQQELSGTLGGIDELRKSSWLARMIIPFFKTGTNIVRMGMERTIPFSTQAYRAAWNQGGREATLMMAKNGLGDMTAAYLAHQYAVGSLTGYGPRNPAVRELWMRDHQPYSLKIAGRWVPLAPTEPTAWIGGMVADGAEMMAHLPNHSALTVGDAVTAATVREFNRQGFWDDLANTVRTLDEAGKEGVDAQALTAGLGNLVGTFVSPQAFNDAAHGIDPVRRKTTSFMDAIRNRIPYLSKDGIPTRDPWGDVVVVPPGFLMNEFPAFKAVSKGADPESDELVRMYHSINYVPPAVPKSIGGPADADNPLVIANYRDGVTLDPKLQDRWAELRGNPRPGEIPSLRDAVKTQIESPRYQTASDPERAKILNAQFTRYRELARKQLFGEHPELRAQIRERNMARRQILETPGPEPVNMGEGGGGGGEGIEAP